ncbi:MAG: hypothetical protein ACHREM_33015, partial [Polyangiales bacterium]
RHVDRARFPAVLDPTVSPETAIDAPVPTSPALGNQVAPAVAFNGAEELVVWSDPRGAIGGGTVIYGARVDSSDDVLDPTGIVLSTATVSGAQHEIRPAVASGGTSAGASGNWLVAFTDAGALMTSTLSGASPSGVANLASSGASNPAVAFVAGDYVVAWQTGSGIVASRVSTTNALVDTTPVSIFSGCTGAPALASNGANLFAACSNGAADSFVWTTVSAAMSVGSVATFSGSGGAEVLSDVAVASDGSHYLLTASSLDNGHVHFLLFDSSGAFTHDPDGGSYLGGDIGDGAIASAPRPSVTFGGNEYVVTWAASVGDAGTSSELKASRITQAGVALDLGVGGQRIAFGATQPVDPSVAYDGANFFVAWQDDRNGAYASDIYAARLNSALGVLGSAPTGYLVSSDDEAQRNASVASGGAAFLVAFEDYAAGPNSTIQGVRVDLTGAPIDLAPLEISNASFSTGGPQQLPFVMSTTGAAAGGDAWGVFWQSGSPSSVEGIGVRADGTIGPGGPFSGATASSPSMACDPSYCLAVWQDDRNAATSGLDLYG